jgi:hypothetical protein
MYMDVQQAFLSVGLIKHMWTYTEEYAAETRNYHNILVQKLMTKGFLNYLDPCERIKMKLILEKGP